MIRRTIRKFLGEKYATQVARIDSTIEGDGYSSGVRKIMNLLTYTRKNNVSYSGYNFFTGYHTLEIGEHTFKGQRNPRLRFKDLPISLNGLTVLDIGCNQGGMLHAFSDQIKAGIGIDYDHKMINAANKIKSYNKAHHLDFYVFNLETENLDYLQDFLPENKVDIALVLSVCMWIKNWKEVLIKIQSLSDKMIFESNGKEHQQVEQIEYLKSLYQNVDLIHERSEDDETQKFRKLLFCY